MGLLQKAVETYDSHFTYASQNREGQSMMAPVGHIVTRAELEIVLDPQGNFLNATAVDKSEPKIIIPATESSAAAVLDLLRRQLFQTDFLMRSL